MPEKLKYSSGNFGQLQQQLQALVPLDNWSEPNKGTYQAKLSNGGILNYYSTTGTINFQGKGELAEEAFRLVSSLLNKEEVSAEDVSSFNAANQEQESAVDEHVFLSSEFPDTEIVIGLVGAVGVEYYQVIDFLTTRLRNYFRYDVHEVRISDAVIRNLSTYSHKETSNHFDRIVHFMEEGNKARQSSANNAILAMGAASKIKEMRGQSSPGRTAYIINTLKHPEEVKYLREIYGSGFFLIGVFADQRNRHRHLTNDLQIPEEKATALIERDKDEKIGHGQHTSDTFDLSDFFVFVDENREKLKTGIYRFLDILFGKPTITPTFEEYAMFTAFVSSLRSADLSRQVGAVITRDREVLATGTNDCPSAGGGLYWPFFDEQKNEISDVEEGRDYKRGVDSNVQEKQNIIDDIIRQLPPSTDQEVIRKILDGSKIKDLTEYGRVVHAEMEALMACARNQISSKGAVLFCTTFPCHNCAKHIIAAGIRKVVYIEPYPKSKALDFHSDAIVLGFAEEGNNSMVYFEPFTGLGPRKFFDLFSMTLGSGRSIKRKTKDGRLYVEPPEERKVKIPLIPLSYLEREERAHKAFGQLG